MAEPSAMVRPEAQVSVHGRFVLRPQAYGANQLNVEADRGLQCRQRVYGCDGTTVVYIAKTKFTGDAADSSA